MSDGQVSVQVRNAARKPAVMKASIDDAGNVVLESPPPGTAVIDPDGEMDNVLQTLELIREIARGKRAEGNPT